MLQIIPQRFVIQSWRSTKFNDGDPDSTLILAFTPEGTNGRIECISTCRPMTIRAWSRAGRRIIGAHGGVISPADFVRYNLGDFDPHLGDPKASPSLARYLTILRERLSKIGATVVSQEMSG
jgi:hypothetical protein